jgi:large subunit ribosomal protein L34
MSTTYQPKKKKRAKTHGFLKRKSSPSGKKILKQRRYKNRHRLTV